MNISSIGINKSTISMNKDYSKNQIAYYYETKNSFHKQTPTFKGGLQTGEELILKNPDLLKKFAEYMAAGFASFIGYKVVTDKTSQDNELQEHPIDNNINEQNEPETQSFEKLEYNNYKEENQILKQKILELEEQLKEKEIKLQEKNHQLTSLSDAPKTDRMPELVKVNFPKKLGRYTTEQEQLKNTILSLPPLEKEAASDLENICYSLIHTPKDEKETKKQDIIRLDEELKQADNNQTYINKIIKSFLNTNEEELTNESKPLSEPDHKNNKEENIFRIETPIIENPKIIGKIELDGKREKLKASTEVIELDPERNLHKIVIPQGVIDVQRAIGALMKQTILKVKEQENIDRIYMLQKIPVKYTKAQDVQSEIIKQKDKGNPYKKITMENSTKIAELLSTGIFSNMFCLHSAMRLIDRYVNLDDKEKTLKEQCDKILSVLNKAILESMKQGLTFKPYRTIKIDNNYNNEFGKPREKVFYSSKIFIDPVLLNEDVQDTLGTPRIDITFAQVNPRYNDINTKGIISTIFSEGV